LRLNHAILVTDGENRSSLAVTRSLGRIGCRVVVSGRYRRNISSQSKYCKSSYQTVDPLENEVQYFNELIQIIRKEKIVFVYPMTEPTLFTLVKNKKQIPSNVSWAAVDSRQITAIFNKYNVFKLAIQQGVAIPKTLFIDQPDEINRKIDQINEYPVVVKSSMSKIPIENGYLSTGVMYARNRKELKDLYQHQAGLTVPSIIQEKIVGPGTGLFTLFDYDKHLALFSHKRILEKPPSGGVSVVCESVPLDPEMVASARKLLASVGWRGVAMVEFKRDNRDGNAKLIEINGRFWGSLQLAISSGIDFPKLLLHYLHGNSFPDVLAQYKVGLRLRWLLGTLDYLLIRLKNKDADLQLPPQSHTKLQAIIEFLKLKKRSTGFDVFDRNDLRPFVLELKEYMLDIVH